MIESQYVFNGFAPNDLIAQKDPIKNALERFGVAVFPGIMNGDSLFERFRKDLQAFTQVLAQKSGIRLDSSLSWDAQLTYLAAHDRPLVGAIYDMGTRPQKLMSGHQLKAHPAFLALIQAIFGDNALIATPTQSDTMHIFPPGSENFRFNLPIHQDFPYLLQSPRQLTFLLTLERAVENIGGLTVWLGSHQLGVCPSFQNDLGYYEVKISTEVLSRYEEVDICSDQGDLVIIDSLLLHRSNENHTPNNTRIVQLFRYSDICVEEALAFHAASSDHSGKGAQYPGIYPSMFVSKSGA
jgi:Protein involved in biosynthesis of mitomycin antibiotics/polyketide fumonisin